MTILEDSNKCLLFAAKLPLGNMQQSPQQNPMIPIIQECIDATTEHQRLRALMKGEWAKGLLPQSSVRADYTVQRICGNYISFISHPFPMVWTFHNCHVTLYPFQGPINLIISQICNGFCCTCVPWSYHLGCLIYLTIQFSNPHRTC